MGITKVTKATKPLLGGAPSGGDEERQDQKGAAEKGEWPEGLAALAPEYLKVLPKDRFTEEALKYRHTADGYVLYGVGENMTDDGGKDQDDGADDIVVRVGSD